MSAGEDKAGKNDPTCPLWMMTFGDCMSLLVTFFVMLIAFSNIEDAQLLDMIGSMKGALGVAPNAGVEFTLTDTTLPHRIAGTHDREQWLTIEELSAVVPTVRMSLQRFGERSVGDAGNYVCVRMVEDGLAFRVDNAVLFGRGSAALLPRAPRYLGPIAYFAKRLGNEIRIVSLVDPSEPVQPTPLYATAWGLCLERSHSVRRAVQELGELPAGRFGSGCRLRGPADRALAGDGRHPREWTELIVVGRRQYAEMTPGEIVVGDRWL